MEFLKFKSHREIRESGFSLIEVIIGIAIFAIGMLALASLQGALTRSTVEAKVRTEAVNIAEEYIEDKRGFEMVLSGGAFAYNDIVDETSSITGSNGVTYTLTVDVNDYYYNLANDNFTQTAPVGAVASDYKTVVVTVEWGDDREFVIEDGTESTDNLGGGTIQVSANISALSVAATGRVSEESEGDLLAPPVSYTPGLNPDIVSLSLGESKFKESLTPEPEVFRENLETRFDVITYSQTGGDSLFLRREEFVAVSCECTLRAADANNPSKSPTMWAGDEYTEPEFVTKAYGEVVSNVAQSPLCGICCRDHHDGAGSALYDPSRPASEYSGGNHKHYSKTRTPPTNPNLPVAAVGEDYVEACRLVRKDGFFRVGQDFRLEGLNTFPEDFLVTPAEVLNYSNYVTGEVYVSSPRSGYVAEAIDIGNGYQLDASAPTVETAPRTAYGDSVSAGDLTLGHTTLPTSTGADFQQLRSRSIYIDNLSSDLRVVLRCIELAADDEAKRACSSGDVELDRTGSINILEIIPFFEVQTTFLNDWQKESLGGGEYSLTNQAVQTNNAHSRGKITKILNDGSDMVNTIVNRGVLGLTATDPINNIDYVLPAGAGWEPGDIDVIIGGATPNPLGRTITGTLRSDVAGLKAANVTITASEAVCSYVTVSGVFTCFIPDSATNPIMTLENFQKPPKTVYVCSSHQWGTPAGELPVKNINDTGTPTKEISLANALVVPLDPAAPYVIWLGEDPCPPDDGVGF